MIANFIRRQTRIWLTRVLFLLSFGILFCLYLAIKDAVPIYTVGDDYNVETENIEEFGAYTPEIAKKLELPKVKNKMPVQDWFEVEGTSRSLFLYSAYLDERKEETSVRVIAITKRQHKAIPYCHIFYADGSREHTKGFKEVAAESWGLAYASVTIRCPCSILNEKGLPPQSVTVRFDKVEIGENESKRVTIQRMKMKDSQKFMAVCIKPLHFDFNRATWLIEFIEFYRLLGADHFFFYNHSVGVDVEKILMSYIEEDMVTLLPWSLPVNSQKEIRTEGIFSALNDCNMRSYGKYELNAMVDIDEFIIPRLHDNYKDLINSLPIATSYIFKNVFYYLHWENDTTAVNEIYEKLTEEYSRPFLLTAYKTRRLVMTHKYGTRSKFFSRPATAIEIGNHLVQNAIYDKKSLKSVEVEEKVCLSHHYRICEYGGLDCLKEESVIDRSAHKWLPQLIKRIAQRCSNAFPDMHGPCPVELPLGDPFCNKRSCD